jgi:hypothetical protein
LGGEEAARAGIVAVVVVRLMRVLMCWIQPWPERGSSEV